MEDYLSFLYFAYKFEILSFVLMSNHFHLLVRTPLGNLSEGMNYFMRETSKQIGRQSQRINQIYGGRFHRSIITKNHYFMHAYKYVYRNPVEAGITDSVTQYQFSTLNRKLGLNPCYIPIAEDPILFDDVDETLRWLNTAPDPESYETIKKAFHKKIFKLERRKHSKLQNPLEYLRY